MHNRGLAADRSRSRRSPLWQKAASARLAIVGLAAFFLIIPGTLSAKTPTAGSPAAPLTASQRSHWCFQPIGRPAVPAAHTLGGSRSPIDAFMLERLSKAGLGLSPPASRRDLIRRATFDLLGLPPYPDDIDRFVADSAPDSYERLIDRLLASPHYGENWGRSWLDLVRFAETAGYNADPTRPLAWKYRDYVIRAFNGDLSFDRFVQQQIAGDELFPDDVDAQIATGYLRMWPDESNASVVALARQDALNDMTSNVGSVFLGLSIGCAQCHDHKFDAIKQHDFYRLEAFFTGIVPVEKTAVGTPEALDEYHRRLDAWLAASRASRLELNRLRSTARAKVGRERRKRFPPDVLAAMDKPVEERTGLEHQLFFWSDRQVVVSEKEMLAQMSAADKKRMAEVGEVVARLERDRPRPPFLAQVMATTEIPGPIPAAFLMAGGAYDKPIREVLPGFLSVLSREPEPVAPIVPPRPGVSGRRTALARWLTQRDNTLVARVIVNRLWQGHMGRGLVDNANDFGTQSPPPTHPALLDWLARELMVKDWSIKAVHRTIMMSDAYRQASDKRRPDEPIPKAEVVDGDNTLYWHYGRRRLTGEQVRDAVLAVAGRLNESMEGPGVKPPLPKSYPKLDSWKAATSNAARDRRSVYIFAKRNLPFPFLKAFDLPDMHESCARRASTIIAPQALALLNGDFVVGCGDAVAERIVGAHRSQSWDARIVEAYRRVLGREPLAAERSDAVSFLRTQAAHIPAERELIADEAAPDGEEAAMRTAFADLCHTLLNANEFLFVE